MSKAKPIRVGVTDFWVATAEYDETTNAITYGTPRDIGGTASVSVSQTKGENKVYESDALIRNHSRTSGANVSYHSRTVSMEDEMDVLYSQAAVADGDYEDGPDDMPRNVAVGWAAKRSDGSYQCVWYYWCTGSKGDENYETATDSENSPEDTYDFAAMPAPDNNKIRRRKIVKTEAEMLAFFGSVRKTGGGNENGGGDENGVSG